MVTARTASARPTVMKFGGAALRDATSMARIGAIVARASRPVVVVASAMEGVTDILHALLAGEPKSEDEIRREMAGLRQRHHDALQGVAPRGDPVATDALDEGLEQLERLLYGIAFTQEITPRLHDRVQSYGERLSVIVLAAALRAASGAAVALDAEAAGIRTTGPYGHARADKDAIRAATAAGLTPHLDAGRIPVVTGYYGVDAGGNATLFGRGGSDYVAALLGAALHAEAVELWKDVPGFLSADPRAVAEAALVPELGFDEAAELAHVGAKVLHPRAVQPVQDTDIPIRIRSFIDPDAPGSVLRAVVADAPRLVRSVASRDGLAIVRLNGPGMADTPGVAKRVFDALATAAVNVLNMSTSQATFALLLDDRDAPRAQAVLEPLVGGVIRSVETIGERSLVCVVGRGLGATPGSAARILQAVATQGVNIEMISLGASDIAIDFIVKSHDRAAALRGVHGVFLEGLGAPDAAADGGPNAATDGRPNAAAAGGPNAATDGRPNAAAAGDLDAKPEPHPQRTAGTADQTPPSKTPAGRQVTP